MNKLPIYCPSCENKLRVKSLYCENCDTTVIGLYTLPILARLSPEDQAFILNFVKFSGSLKEMASHLGLSYPTVRNMLDELIGKLNELEKEKHKNKNEFKEK